MIDRDNFHILNFVKKEAYTGSMDGMRYIIKREGDRVKATIWPEPFCFAATDDDKKTSEYFTLDEDGITDVADWLNKQMFDRADEWKAAKDKGCRLQDGIPGRI